ncbi:MAG: hypothetical protein RI910_287 [Verrucomicrobiota bacterium]
MIDEEDDDAGAGERVGEGDELRPALQRLRQGGHVRLDGEDFQARIGEVRSDLDGGRFTEVIDVRFEGEAKAGDHGVLACGGADLGDDVMRLGVVDFAGGPQETRFGRGGVDDEPRIDGDAVSADARTGLEDLHARMAVRQTDEFPDIDAQFVADQSSLAKAMFTSRKAFSVSLASSAVRASVRKICAVQKEA